MDIPRYLNSDFSESACQCCWSHSMRTRVTLCVGDQKCFLPRATMAIVPGDKTAHKRLTSSAAA